VLISEQGPSIRPQSNAKARDFCTVFVPPTRHLSREHQVLAEYAFKQKDEEKAIREYMAALEIFPTWPEGQFNVATLAGEKKYYELAVMHMKEYLELVPNSPDAQAAKDSIIIWHDKLSTLLAK
jgi:tetratricopeptide (TPR) repeat protein